MRERHTPPRPTYPDAFKAQIVAIANSIQKSLTGDFGEVEALLKAHDVVFAVWPDTAEADGVGTLIVKGQARLRKIIASGRAEDMSITAIPCIEAAQAVALQQVAGEPDGRH